MTPKGADATLGYERGTFFACAAIAFTVVGLAINLPPEWRRVEDGSLLPLVAMWSTANLVVLFLVCLLCLQTPIRRQEERFSLDETVLVRHSGGALVTLMCDAQS